jgi:hypothetical protein
MSQGALANIASTPSRTGGVQIFASPLPMVNGLDQSGPYKTGNELPNSIA